METLSKKMLKPCPFCGANAKLVERAKTTIKGETAKCSFVRCKSCYARTKRFFYKDYPTSEEVHQAAMKAWEQRVSCG